MSEGGGEDCAVSEKEKMRQLSKSFFPGQLASLHLAVESALVERGQQVLGRQVAVNDD
jgi:hypothetical protein